MNEKYTLDQESLVVDEVLLFLQEKRTSLAMIRIGIATLLAQISILGFLIATSKYYVWMEVPHLVIPFVALNLIVLCIAGYFIVGPLIQIHRLDRQILNYKKNHDRIAPFMDFQ